MPNAAAVDYCLKIKYLCALNRIVVGKGWKIVRKTIRY